MQTFYNVLTEFFDDKSNIDFVNNIQDYSGSQISSYLLRKNDLTLIAFAYVISKAMPHISKLIWENPKDDLWRLSWYVNDEFTNSLYTQIAVDVNDLDAPSISDKLGFNKSSKLYEYLYSNLMYALDKYYNLNLSLKDIRDFIQIIDDSEIELKASQYE